MPWLCDNMANELQDALGGLNNSEFVFDPEGKLVRLRDWSTPSQLRNDLEQLVGRVDQPTHADDIRLRPESSTQRVARGVVRRIETPDRMQSVVASPLNTEGQVFYAKLYASATDELLEDGSGKLYLEFRLDPVHRVHWNNLAAPIEYEIKTNGTASASPAIAKAEKVDHESDLDPREFLLDVQHANSQTQLELTVRYFACSDDEGWCKPVSQSYVIKLQRDRSGEGGRRSRRRGR